VQFTKDHFMKTNSENLEYCREEFRLKEENGRLKKENDRPDCLLDYCIEERSGVVAMCHVRAAQQRADALWLDAA
jgi:hypothetical protein